MCTVEPLSKDTFGGSHFVSDEKLSILEFKNDLHVHIYCYMKGNNVLCWEVVPFLEGPLLEVPL